MANIKVFARLKPCEDVKRGLFKHEDQALYILSDGQARTCAESNSDVFEDSNWLRFSFARVLGADSSQNKVFEVVAKDIVSAFLEGYNGTIFAYGQTGAGKTFTLRGTHALDDFWNVSENFGLIPQSLSFIFQRVIKFQQESFDIHVSFLEIYNEKAYDLLGPLLLRGSKDTKKLSKVLVTVGGKGSCHLHGLSCHHVTSEEEAAGLYELGISNRKIVDSDASCGHRSSRSHLIFTIALSRQKDGAEILFRSKLHLVDLAGSEQARRSGKQLDEEHFFNLSLYHLESVVIALKKFSSMRGWSKRRRTSKSLDHSSSAVEINERQSSVGNDSESNHTLYKNSILTMVLQESLGGNCNAAMIALLSLEEKDLCETISTCRFAQKVACVINSPSRNEVIDKDAVIKRLQATLGKLYLQVAFYEEAERAATVAHNCSQDGPTGFRGKGQFFVGRSSDSADEMDSGIRSNSEPATPVVSEEENDHAQMGVSRRFIVRKSFPVLASADANHSEHRLSVNTEDSGILVSVGSDETLVLNDRPGSFSMAQPIERKSRDVSTQASLLIADPKETNRLEQSADKEEARQQALRNISENLRVKEETTCQKLLAYGRRFKNLSSASLCTFRSGNREVNSSEAVNVGNSSATALCCKENKGLVPTPPIVAHRSVVLKPSGMKKRVGDASFAANNKELKPRSASPRATLLNHEKSCRKAKGTRARGESKSLEDFMNSSRQSLYLKSTFPRKIIGLSETDTFVVSKAPEKSTTGQGRTVKNGEVSVLMEQNSTSECSEERTSTKAECGLINFTAQATEESTPQVDCVMQNLNLVGVKSKALKLPPLSSSSEGKAFLERKMQFQSSPPSNICFRREQIARVLKIRKSVNAAVVIQRSWRLYKLRRENDEIP